ncbi:hypothetical protein SAMN05428989_1822 [Pseudoxanthomonas sp. GM95]|uniref:hypothetical protein n=1 Tax=Pseudoxanthomonas sp. GM95 TaxID=1881043 RepID=UPI0008B65A6F|nr:hypothetical protein [Pseudoxanthomonas sp. GM95]SEL51527.1 hypothetical protein SAMN05428989_1822 [Pseudoxanthomonas sp. GM95]
MDFWIAIPIIAFIVLAVIWGFRIARFGGTSGALFKSRITRTAGSLNVVNTPLELRVKVHVLGRAEPGWVGVEFERFNGDALQVSPMTLSKTEALALADLLKDAATSK